MSQETYSKITEGKLESSEKKYKSNVTESFYKERISSNQKKRTYKATKYTQDYDDSVWLSAITGSSEEELNGAKGKNLIESGFSDTYIQLKTRELVDVVTKELYKWSKLETHEALVHVSSIKDEIDEKFNFVSRSQNHRIFVSALRLIVSQWEVLNPEKVKSLAEHMSNYSDGQISSHDIKSLNNFLFSQEINPFASYGKKEK